MPQGGEPPAPHGQALPGEPDESPDFSPDEPHPVLPPGITVESVGAAMAGLDKKERGWGQAALIFGVSLLFFISQGLFQNPAIVVAILIAVLFLHELGHYLGMKLFNYRNVRMFFIPFFGAAVSGKNTSAEGWKVGVVALLGPVPNLALGILAANFYFQDPVPWLGRLASMLLLVNAFNLLPLYPLDGGRFLNEVLFGRNRYLEAAFRVLTGGLLIFLGWLIPSWPLAVVGAGVVLFSSHTYKISKLAEQMKEWSAWDPGEPGSGEAAGLSEPLLLGIRLAFPFLSKPQEFATQAREVLEKMRSRPPGLLPAALLMGVYVLACACVVEAVVLLRELAVKMAGA